MKRCIPLILLRAAAAAVATGHNAGLEFQDPLRLLRVNAQ